MSRHFFRLLSTFLLIGFLLPICNAQLWIAKLIDLENGLGQVFKVVENSDNDLVVIFPEQEILEDDKSISRIVFKKYNQEGEELVKKSYNLLDPILLDTFSSLSNSVGDFIQTETGEFVLTGVTRVLYPLKDNSYFMRLNAEGDSLYTKVYPEEVEDWGALINLKQVSEGEYLCTRRSRQMVYLNDYGTLTDSIQFDTTIYNNQIVEDDFVIAAARGDFTSDDLSYFQRLDFNGNLVDTFSFLNVGHTLARTNDGNYVSYAHGLLKFDAGFNLIWHQPFVDLNFIIDNENEAWQDGTVVKATSDGGYILGGSFAAPGASFENHRPYLIKTNSIGEWEWGWVYNSPIHVMNDVIEVSDGFVAVGFDWVILHSWMMKVPLDGNPQTSNIIQSNDMFIPLEVFPNPCKEAIWIQWQEYLKGELSLINQFGQAVYLTKVEGQSIQLNIEYLPSGIYAVVLQTPKGRFSQKIIKQ